MKANLHDGGGQDDGGGGVEESPAGAILAFPRRYRGVGKLKALVRRLLVRDGSGATLVPAKEEFSGLRLYRNDPAGHEQVRGTGA